MATHRKFHIRVLGCAKNLIDAENISGKLIEKGWFLTNEPEEADLLILAICSFIETARRESEAVYKQMVRIKRKYNIPLVLTGCHPTHLVKSCWKMFPEADCILSPWQTAEFACMAEGLLMGERVELISSPPDEPPADTGRLLLTPPHLAFLRLSDGCSNRCTFCTIPLIRGKHRPKNAEELLAEAVALASLGVKELVLIAQDTTAWFCPKTGMRLPELLENLNAVDGLQWIRLMYAHPARITKRLARAIKDLNKVLPYIDLPIQHVSEEILKSMGRVGGRRAVFRAVELLKDVPNICIRTTIMVGFPGETEEQFEELLSFVREVRFCRIGVFSYSREDGTKAASFETPPSDVVKRRFKRARRVASALMLSLHKRLLGGTEDVIVDWTEENRSVCRTYRDAPQVDGIVIVPEQLEPGKFVKVRFQQARATNIIASLQRNPQ